jgi:hypothetical protein
VKRAIRAKYMREHIGGLALTEQRASADRSRRPIFDLYSANEVLVARSLVELPMPAMTVPVIMLVTMPMSVAMTMTVTMPGESRHWKQHSSRDCRWVVSASAAPVLNLASCSRATPARLRLCYFAKRCLRARGQHLRSGDYNGGSDHARFHHLRHRR